MVLSLAACAPTVDGPVERQRTIDREDADRLAAQLGVLPGAISASVTLHRAVTDPLAGTTSPAAAVVLLVVDDAANRDELARTARSLVAASAPDVPAPTVQIVVGAHRPELASVGPFRVEERSAGPLKIMLAVALAVIAALAGWIAISARRAA
jgi:type III secretory pathway lipoprotein EscJ